MKIFLTVISAVILGFGCLANAGDAHKIQMSLDDTFVIAGSTSWNFEIEKELTLRFADIKVTPKRGEDFNMMLYFKCDTSDLSLFDTPEKIRCSVEKSSEQYLPWIQEKKIILQKVPKQSTYGFYTVLTDADVAKKTMPAPGEFKYMTRGMVRLSKDSVLGFSIMSNSTSSKTYEALLDYVYSFVKPGIESTLEGRP
jgi:hypothetical protein